MLFKNIFLTAAGLVSMALAGGHCAGNTGITDADRATKRFAKAQIAPGVVAPAFKPTVHVDIDFNGKLADYGNTYQITETVPAPTLSFTREQGHESSTNYTVMFVDPDAPGPKKNKAEKAALSFFLHTLMIDVHPTCSGMNGTEATVTPYISLTPLSLAKHRYIALVYRQPEGIFTPKTQLAFTTHNNFDLDSFVKEGNLVLVGGNYILEGLKNV